MPFSDYSEYVEHVARRQNDKRRELLKFAAPLFFQKWHHFKYHFSRLPPTHFGTSLLDACLTLERIAPDAPRRFISELAQIGGREKNQDDYNQILQKLAEILVAQQVASMPWPKGTRFKIEEEALGSPKCVDLVATTSAGSKIGFEVKAPATTEHATRRAERPVQIPMRSADGFVEHVREVFGEATLPRDNTVRDFLRSANKKFKYFKKADPSFLGILVIVWDDFIYECLNPLTNPESGLLTPKSYSRIDGLPERFEYVDAVIVLRHLAYFADAAVEGHLGDRRDHAFHVGGPGSLPNVIIPVAEALNVPNFVVDGFNARPIDDPFIQHAAEYQNQDFIMWFDSSSPAGKE
ncbi:hypothetical protein [Azospirillum endophyticum]